MEVKKKTLKDMAREALNVQNACNLSGVVHSLSRLLPDLREILEKEEGFSTTVLNQHPVVFLFTTQIASLSGVCVFADADKYADAYQWAQLAAEDKLPTPESDTLYRQSLRDNLPANCHPAIANASGIELDKLGASYHCPRG